jgi:hypothetical protein
MNTHTSPTRRNPGRAARWAAAFALAGLLLPWGGTASAVIYTNIVSGNWNATTTWSPSGVPAEGDAIRALSGSLRLTNTADASFGSSSAPSTNQAPTYINPGVTLTHVANSTLSRYSGELRGGGTFVNRGTYIETFRGTISNATLVNEGVLATSSQWLETQTNGVLRMAEGSTFRKTTTGNVNLSGSGLLTSVDAGGVLRAANFDVQAGTLYIYNSSTGQIRFATLNLAGGAILKLGAPNLTYSSADPNVFAATGQVQIVSTFRAGSDFVFTTNVAWSAGDLRTNGRNVTNAAGATATSTGSFYGNGTFVNNGTHTHNGRFFMYDGVTYENYGTLAFTGPEYGSWSGTLHNAGTISVQNSFYFTGSSSNAAILRNVGTVQVTTNTLVLQNNLDTRQFLDTAGKALTSGTWKVLAPSSGTATMRFDRAASSKITTIGPAAAVVLQNSGWMPDLESTLSTVHGSLMVNGSKVLSPTGTVTVSSSGIVGGTGLIRAPLVVNGTLAPGQSVGTLTVSNNVTLSGTARFEIDSTAVSADLLAGVGTLTYGGTLSVTNLGLQAGFASGQIYNLFDFAGMGGTFSTIVLPSLPSGLSWKTFSGEGQYDQQFDYVGGTLEVIPEPGSLGVLFSGAWLFALRRRRRAGRVLSA